MASHSCKGHRIYAALYDLFDRLDRRRMLPLRQLVAGEARGRVLEIGCGTGANFEHYTWTRIHSLEAIEPDPYMLRRAEARARRLPLLAREKLRLIRTKAESLPFEDAQFDTVVATLVLCSVADPAAVLAEVRRVLKAGGTLRLLEHVREQGRWGRVQDALQPVYGWFGAGCHWNRRTEDLLRAAGFDLQVEQRLRFGPLFPAFRGVARTPG